MVAYNSFNIHGFNLGIKVHDLRSTGDTLKVYGSNTVPNAETQEVKANLAEITAQNGYPAGGSDIQNNWTRSAATSTLSGSNVVWTASGGSFGPLRYVVMYNDTPTSPADPLIGWWDYGSSVTVQDGETFTIQFGAAVATQT